MSCAWAWFVIGWGSHTMPGQQHSQPTSTSLGQGCWCNLPPAKDNWILCRFVAVLVFRCTRARRRSSFPLLKFTATRPFIKWTLFESKHNNNVFLPLYLTVINEKQDCDSILKIRTLSIQSIQWNVYHYLNIAISPRFFWRVDRFEIAKEWNKKFLEAVDQLQKNLTGGLDMAFSTSESLEHVSIPLWLIIIPCKCSVCVLALQHASFQNLFYHNSMSVFPFVF